MVRFKEWAIVYPAYSAIGMNCCICHHLTRVFTTERDERRCIYFLITGRFPILEFEVSLHLELIIVKLVKKLDAKMMGVWTGINVTVST